VIYHNYNIYLIEYFISVHRKLNIIISKEVIKLSELNEVFYLNEKLFDPKSRTFKNTAYITAGVGAVTASSNLLEIHRLKKELKELQSPKGKEMYKNSTTQKTYNQWVSEKKKYIEAQIKDLRTKNVAALGVTAGGVYLGKSENKDIINKANNIKNKINHNKFTTGVNVATTGGLGLGGTIVSVKKLADVRKELKVLKTNPVKSKELYKKSRSLLKFDEWKKERIKYLQRQTKLLVGGTAASLGMLGLSAAQASQLFKEEFALDEFFHGKNKILEEVEDKLFGNLIDAISHNKNPYIYRKEIQESEKILTEFFNVEKIKIHIGADYSGVNAFTLSWQHTTVPFEKINFDTVENSSGIKFVDPTSKILNIYIYPSLLTGDYTKEELMATLLHEIGHNFFVNKRYRLSLSISELMNTIFNLLLAYARNQIDFKKFIELLKVVLIQVGQQYVLQFIPTPVRILFIKAIRLILQPLEYDIIGDKLHMNLTPFYKLLGYIKSIIKSGINIASLLFSPLIILFKIGITYLLKGILKRIGTLGLDTLNYQAEKFADAFAAKFGYGTDLIRALDKMNDAQNGLDLVAHLSNLTSMILLYSGAYFADEHPTNQTRAVKILELYKHDLAKYGNKLNDKQKQEIKKQISELEKRVKMTKDKGLIKNIQIALDKPYRAAREAIDNTLSGRDGTFAPN